MGKHTIRTTVVPQTTKEFDKYFKDVRRQAGAIGFLCAIVKIKCHPMDAYRIHWHIWGWLRPHRTQILLETVSLSRYAIINKEHAYTLMVEEPSSFSEAMLILRQRYKEYEFVFNTGRHE